MNEFIHKGLFDKIENKTNIKSADILHVVDSVQAADFRDEETVRELVKRLSSLANVAVSQETEDSIVDSIINHNGPLDFRQLSEMADEN